MDILTVEHVLGRRGCPHGCQEEEVHPGYRQEAARLVIDTGRTIAEVAREIGVGEALLGRWVALERSRMDDPPEALDVDERAELERLRREVAELRMDRQFLKNSGLLRHGEQLEPERAFEMIEAEKATHSITRMSDLLGVSRSGYSAWTARQASEPGPREARRADLTVKIEDFHKASDGVNGAPRILADLREAGEKVSRKTVAKLMRHNGIRGISPRPWVPVTTIADAKPAPPISSVAASTKEPSTRSGPQTSHTWPPTRAGCTCAPCATGARAACSGTPSPTPCTPTSSRTRYGAQSPSAPRPPAPPPRSPSMRTAAVSTPPASSLTSPKNSTCVCLSGAPGCAGTTPSKRASGPR